MTESNSENDELIRTYQTQLKAVDEAILRQEEETGVASADLRQLRADLREALALFEASEVQITSDPPLVTLEESEPPECLTLSSDSDSDADSELEDEVEVDEILKEIAGTNCSVNVSCSATGLTRHNAVVLGIESISDRTVKVLFSQPTRLDRKPCSHFLNDSCRFGAKCRYSHGFVVPVDDLLDYLDPKDQTFAVGQSVLCQHGAEGLWKPGTIETVEPDNHLCVVRFTHFNGLEAISFGSIRIINQPESIENAVDEIPVTFEFLPSVNFGSSQSDEFGQWERHTRGIGSKLMAKMGYRSGQGLGRHNQGRVNPIEARVLPKGKSLDAVMALKNKTRLPNALKIRRQRKKMMKTLSTRSTTEENGVFTFLDRVLTSEIRSTPTESSPSPLDRFKEPQETVTESSLLLHAEIGRRNNELRALAQEIRRLEQRLKFNESHGTSTIVSDLRHRLAAKKLQYAKLEQVEANLQSRREQIRAKKRDIF